MTFLSGSFRSFVLSVMAGCAINAAAQDRFFEFFISDYPHALKAFQFSRNESHFLVSTFHQSESTRERFIPSHHEGRVYEVSSGRLVGTFSSSDVVRWLPATDHVLVTGAKTIYTLSIQGDTVHKVDLSDHLKTYKSIKNISLSADGAVTAVRSGDDSLYVHETSTGKFLMKLGLRLTGFQYPEFTGNNQYLAAQTGPSWDAELWNIQTAAKADSFRLYDRFWLKPKQYFINDAGRLIYLNDMSTRNIWPRQENEVLDPGARYLGRAYAYRGIDIIDLVSGDVIQHIPLNEHTSWMVFVNAQTIAASVFSGESSTLRFFNIEFGEEIFTLDADDLNGYMDFHPPGSLYLATGKKKMLLLQCAETGVRKVFEHAFDQLYYARFSASGEHVIALHKNFIELFRTRDGNKVMQIKL